MIVGRLRGVEASTDVCCGRRKGRARRRRQGVNWWGQGPERWAFLSPHIQSKKAAV